ncbi:MAG TPA: serpin family protein [Xanthobacteraceae bacterium]|nr:serpin family protein [Xanthobacteraceae bacterium]
MRRRDFLASATALACLAQTRISLAALLTPDRLLDAQGRLGFSLLSGLAKTRRAGENVVLSPASLAAVLSLLDVGADAKMRVALHKTLGFDGPDNKTASDDLMEVRNAVRDLLRATDGPLLLANALVIDPEVKPRADAIAQMRALGAEITLADVRKPEVIKQINDWVAARTKGRIPSILDAPPDQGAVALNALYFKDFWQRQFEKSATQAKPFHGVGVSAEVPMMRQTARHAFRQDDRFVAVDLPYRTGRYSFVVLTTKDKPAPAAEFAPVASWLDGRGFRSGNVRLELPRFTATDNAGLLPILAGMGLREGLASPTAFSGLAQAPLTISGIQQRTFLKVDEEGTEAAAVTGVMMATRMAEIGEVPVIVDKPFLFVLRDKESGLMIMSGYIGKPTNGSFAAR